MSQAKQLVVVVVVVRSWLPSAAFIWHYIELEASDRGGSCFGSHFRKPKWLKIW